MKIQTYKDINTFKQNNKLVLDKILDKTQAHDEQRLHLSTHLLIYNLREEFYLRKRSETELRYPGLYTTTIGTHVELNKTYHSTLKPLLPNKKMNIKYIGEFRVKDEWENEINGLHAALALVNCFPEDFDKDRYFIPKKELELLIKNNMTTPHLAQAYELFNREIK